MEFIDLATQQNRIKETVQRNILKVLDHGKYIMGPEVYELEEKLSAFVEVRHAVSCASGTDALLMALMAYKVGPGDAIFTTPFSFIATAEVIGLLGATPVFVDVDEKTFNMSPPDLARAIRAVQDNDASVHPLPSTNLDTPLTPKGIIAVDLFGLPADYDNIGTIALENELFLIGDAAQSLGSTYKGMKAAALPNIACTSFFPAKPLGCYGDGGMCFTNDEASAEKLRSIRLHGKGSEKYDNIRIGINGRLDTLQAAVLLAKTEIFAEEITLRQKVARQYSLQLEDTTLDVPFIPKGYESVWAQYSVLTKTGDERSTLMNALKKEGIPSAIYYPKPLHLQTAFKPMAYQKGDFRVSESLSRRIFSLPMHPYLDRTDQQSIVRCICGLLNR